MTPRLKKIQITEKERHFNVAIRFDITTSGHTNHNLELAKLWRNSVAPSLTVLSHSVWSGFPGDLNVA